MRPTTLLMIAILSITPLTALQLEQNDANLEDNAELFRTGRNCDPTFDSTLNGLTFTPDEPVALELDLSCFEYQLIHDIDPDGKMDFYLQVLLFEINSVMNSEQIWFANQNSKNGVGFNSVLWDFNQGSTSFTEVFYLNGPINNDAENDNDLWPLAPNNLTPYTNYTVQVSLISLNQTYDHTEYHSFSIVPLTTPEPCEPLLKTFTTNNPDSTATEPLENGNFYYYDDLVYNHLELSCLTEQTTYHVNWRISYWTGLEVENGWWNVTATGQNATTTIVRLASDIHVEDGSIKYTISGVGTYNVTNELNYYPNPAKQYSYGSFWINISDLDDDGIEDILDNCQSEPNPEQLDFDSNGVGDVCDTDIDGDNLSNSIPPNLVDDDDKCPYEFASTSQDLDGDGCIDPTDQDGDGILDANDNCIHVPNPNQANLDDDAQGDACDLDVDGDGVYNSVPINTADSNNFDACPYVDSSGKDENQDGCIDLPEPVECAVCNKPVQGNETNTLLDSGDMGAIAVVGGSGMLLGLALAYVAMKALNLVRFERTSSDTLAHMPNRKTTDLYSDHYSRKGIVRQQEMTLSARMDLDDYVSEENEGDETNE